MGRGQNTGSEGAALRRAASAPAKRAVTEVVEVTEQLGWPTGLPLADIQKRKLINVLRTLPAAGRRLLLIGEPDESGEQRFSIPAYSKDGPGNFNPVAAKGGVIERSGHIRWC